MFADVVSELNLVGAIIAQLVEDLASNDTDVVRKAKESLKIWTDLVGVEVLAMVA